MKVTILAIWICLSALPVVAGNQNGQGQDNQGGNSQGNGGGVHAAPAPLIGGLPVALIAGGVWVGRKLWQKRRR